MNSRGFERAARTPCRARRSTCASLSSVRQGAAASHWFEASSVRCSRRSARPRVFGSGALGRLSARGYLRALVGVGGFGQAVVQSFA
jgi:hypothetical protein